jgi:hypothetical protein
LTMAVAFSAGVALAQFRGGLFSRNKPVVVDSRVATSGTASDSYPEQVGELHITRCVPVKMGVYCPFSP